MGTAVKICKVNIARAVDIVKAIRAADYTSLKEAKDVYDCVRDGTPKTVPALVLGPEPLVVVLRHFGCVVEIVKDDTTELKMLKRELETKVQAVGGRVVWGMEN